MGKPFVKPEFYTYSDYYAWPDAIRAELIDGEFHDMTPAPTTLHQRITGSLYAQLFNFFLGKPCEPFVAPFDVRFPRPGDEDGMERDVVQPDVVVVCDASKIDERGCRGAPDWIIEVLSGRTVKKDLTLKHELYERNGVPLYWVVSPRKRTFTAWHLDSSGHYVSTGAQSGRGRHPVLEYPGLEINWELVFRDRSAG
jgi:Uma2 family endonuclease